MQQRVAWSKPPLRGGFFICKKEKDEQSIA